MTTTTTTTLDEGASRRAWLALMPAKGVEVRSTGRRKCKCRTNEGERGYSYPDAEAQGVESARLIGHGQTLFDSMTLGGDW